MVAPLVEIAKATAAVVAAEAARVGFMVGEAEGLAICIATPLPSVAVMPERKEENEEEVEKTKGGGGMWNKR